MDPVKLVIVVLVTIAVLAIVNKPVNMLVHKFDAWWEPRAKSFERRFFN